MLNRHSWNYIGQTGNVQLIALQHDTSTGDLLIFYGKELLWAERGVRGAQVISFFADDELCRIHVSPKGNQLFYEFEIDRKENTPLNNIRKAEERSNWLKSFLFVGAIAGGLGAFILGGYLINKYADRKALREIGVNTTAKFIVSHTFNHASPEIACRIAVNRTFVDNWIKLGFVGDSLVLPCGLPVYNDDQFSARVDPNELTNNSVDLESPSDTTVRELIFRTRDNYHFRHPETKLEDIDCLVRRIHKLAGLRGMADFYYQDEPPIRNILHNSMTYYILTRHPEFAEKVLTCQ
ncbi:MAG: hypothetical protein RI894_1914 [Bacteroidota bacterium]